MMRNGISRWLVAVAVFAGAGCTVAALPAPTEEIPLSQQGRWTNPIIYHGVAITFELAQGEEASLVLPGEEIDFLGIRGRYPRGFDFRFERFYLRGEGHHFDSGSTVYSFLPAAAGDEWSQSYGGLTLQWEGDGETYAVEARSRAQVAWILGAAKIQLARNGRVHYARRADVREWMVPLTLRLDPAGRIVGDSGGRAP